MDATQSTGERPARQSQTRRIFFSYARADSEFVLKLAKDLRAAGKNLWLDQLDIQPGDMWDQSVEVALKTSPDLLVVLSPASVASANVMDEVSFALEERKRIVPILYRKCDIPFRLKRLQYIDFSADYRSALEALLHVLVPTTEPVAPEPPPPRPRQLIWINIAAIAATLFIAVVVGVVYLVERRQVVPTPQVVSTPINLNTPLMSSDQERSQSGNGNAIGLWAGTGGSGTTPFGGPPYCYYQVEMDITSLSIHINSLHQVDSANLAATMTESEPTGCLYPPIPTNTHRFSLERPVFIKQKHFEAHLAGHSANAPRSDATLSGTILDGPDKIIRCEITFRRTDGSMFWTVHVSQNLLFKAEPRQ